MRDIWSHVRWSITWTALGASLALFGVILTSTPHIDAPNPAAIVRPVSAGGEVEGRSKVAIPTPTPRPSPPLPVYTPEPTPTPTPEPTQAPAIIIPADGEYIESKVELYSPTTSKLLMRTDEVRTIGRPVIPQQSVSALEIAAAQCQAIFANVGAAHTGTEAWKACKSALGVAQAIEQQIGE